MITFDGECKKNKKAKEKGKGRLQPRITLCNGK